MRETVSEAATDAVLDAVQALSGDEQERRPGALEGIVAERRLSGAMAALDEHGKDSFDRRLAAASTPVAAPALPQRESNRVTIDDLRSSFPEESREFAVLIFACMELIDAVCAPSQGGETPSSADLARKEALLAKVAALLEPRAGEALQSFVAHIVATSRRARGQR